jgi:uncharacterized protein YciI
MPLFVKIEKGVVPKRVFDGHVSAHKKFVLELVAEGRRARSGYWAEMGGGMMIFEAASLEEARRIVARDPLIKEGLVTYELHEWKVVVGDGA